MSDTTKSFGIDTSLLQKEKEKDKSPSISVYLKPDVRKRFEQHCTHHKLKMSAYLASLVNRDLYPDDDPNSPANRTPPWAAKLIDTVDEYRRELEILRTTVDSLAKAFFIYSAREIPREEYPDAFRRGMERYKKFQNGFGRRSEDLNSSDESLTGKAPDFAAPNADKSCQESVTGDIQ